MMKKTPPEKPQLLGLDTAQLERLVRSLGEPAYRGRQLADWLYIKNATSFSEMTDLPSSFRAALESEFSVGYPEIESRQRAEDATTKLLFRFADGDYVEGVYLPYFSGRHAACVSSQAGCAIRCAFCASGLSGLSRNLKAGEIVAQFLLLQREAGRRLQSVVFMGMGEPLMNLKNVLTAIYLLTREVGLSERKITVSTVGIPDKILELAEHDLNITLALSLHAARQEVREQLIPLAKRFLLDEVMESVRAYFARTRRRVTFEYILLPGINNSEADAKALQRCLKGLPGLVNVIPYNVVAGLPFRSPSVDEGNSFKRRLTELGLKVTERTRKGRQIAAACGQLRYEKSFIRSAATDV